MPPTTPATGRHPVRQAVGLLSILLAGGESLAAGPAAHAAPHHHTRHTQHRIPAPLPVVLRSRPGTELDRQARLLNADLLRDAARHHDRPIILTGTARLSPHQKDTILFVQLQSYRLCGSAGCTTSVYRRNGTKWDTLLDDINGSIGLSRHSHKGMADLLVDGKDRWIFDGTKYQDTLASP